MRDFARELREAPWFLFEPFNALNLFSQSFSLKKRAGTLFGEGSPKVEAGDIAKVMNKALLGIRIKLPLVSRVLIKII